MYSFVGFERIINFGDKPIGCTKLGNSLRANETRNGGSLLVAGGPGNRLTRIVVNGVNNLKFVVLCIRKGFIYTYSTLKKTYCTFAQARATII